MEDDTLMFPVPFTAALPRYLTRLACLAASAAALLPASASAAPRSSCAPPVADDPRARALAVDDLRWWRGYQRPGWNDRTRIEAAIGEALYDHAVQDHRCWMQTGGAHAFATEVRRLRLPSGNERWPSIARAASTGDFDFADTYPLVFYWQSYDYLRLKDGLGRVSNLFATTVACAKVANTAVQMYRDLWAGRWSGVLTRAYKTRASTASCLSWLASR